MTYRVTFKKYKNETTYYNGRRYDSKFEAGVAAELDLLLAAGDITEIEPQYKVEMWAYTKDGRPALKKSHKIDFRVKNKDGSYTLIEAKGFETADYKDRLKWLESFWLPENPDHTYEVWKQQKRKQVIPSRKMAFKKGW